MRKLGQRAVRLASACLFSVLTAGAALQAQTPCINGMAGPYPCEDIQLLSITPTSIMGGSTGLNDIWGWTGPNEHEYALIGTREGTAFVDVTDPISPTYIGFLPSHIEGTNTWRDVKVYADHAYIGSEQAGHGIQIFDLMRLIETNPLSLPLTFSEDAHFDGIGSSHNIVINEETGYVYPVGGAADFAGGPYFINIQDPTSPILEGGYGDEGYSHDAQVVIYDGPDEAYVGKEIYIGSHGQRTEPLVIVDVTDKGDPSLISRSGYPDQSYCHQGWLTEDHRYLLQNDETDEVNLGVPFTRTHMWDLLDLDAPVYLGFYESPTPSSDHNLYVRGNYCFQSNYQSGLRILDISMIGEGLLEEVAHFDLYPQNDDPGYRGTWSNYPYFASGNIIMTHRDSGLFVVRPTTIELLPNDTFVTESDLTFRLIGNMVDSRLTIYLNEGPEARTLLITDLRGRHIKSIRTGATFGRRMNIDVSDLKQGIYLLSVEGLKESGQRFFVE